MSYDFFHQEKKEEEDWGCTESEIDGKRCNEVGVREYHHNMVHECCVDDLCNKVPEDKELLRTELCQHQINNGHDPELYPYCDYKGLCLNIVLL